MSNFQADLLNNVRTFGRRTTKFGRIAHVGRGVFLVGQRRPYRNSAGPQRSPISGLLSIYAYILRRTTTEFDVVYTLERGALFGTTTLLIPRKKNPRIPQFLGFFYIYACAL